MKKEFSILIIIFLTLTFIPINVKADPTTMYVDPQLSTAEIFHTFQLNISVSQVTDLAAWEFKLYYHNSFLNATQIQEGAFLKTAGSTAFFIQNFTDNYNETHGLIWAYCTLLGQGPGATGSGTLATITFKAEQAGTTTLHLAETDLLDSKMPPNRITHTTVDGTVRILEHDIAILNVNPLKTIVGQGFTMNISITVTNKGDFPETFEVILYANETEIETKEIALQDDASSALTFTWNTAGYGKGNYILSAYAQPVQGEIKIADNLFIDNWVKVAIVGDVNVDGTVDIYDLIMVATSFGSRIGDQTYNPNTDINNDGTIDIYDLIIVASHFGETDA